MTEGGIELVTFSIKECYVYQIPPASSLGHRAEMWDVNTWLKEVTCQVVNQGEECYVRLLDKDSGDLFAECPIAKDAPFHSCVEQVVDSSRYFVIKIVDRESKRHAFVGIGFRERHAASNFTAALDDYRQYLRRKNEADKIQEKEEQQPKVDYSLKPGEQIQLNMTTVNKIQNKGGKGGKEGLRAKYGDVLLNPGTGLVIPPPKLDQQQQLPNQQILQPQISGIQQVPQQQKDEEDDFGDFVG
eukprot:TRINITY_DN17591_c1_g1_i3.p1 TRINITY_DN17591_c1_g1~~TRINITY_DN17591_c1_g1_i3.p1  ORF type:complete len:267 (+),score=34.10 TRINITY_DN17591_c1_g1_i3:75-803(+)